MTNMERLADMGPLCLVIMIQVYFASSEIRSSKIINKLSKVRPVGAELAKSFVPLTEFPPPKRYHKHGPSGRRHLDEDCTPKPRSKVVPDGPNVDIIPEYYDDQIAKTVATVIIPDHIDHKHFEVTTQVPYLTVGPIDGLGYHPSTMKSQYPSECEKIYQDHQEEQYSMESMDYSEESLEMARVPVINDEEVEEKLPFFYGNY